MARIESEESSNEKMDKNKKGIKENVNFLHLMIILVLKPYRRLGIASQIFDFLMD